MRKYISLIAFLLVVLVFGTQKIPAQEQAGQPLTQAQRESLLSVLAEGKERAMPIAGRLITLQRVINEQLLSAAPNESAIRNHRNQIQKIVSQLVKFRIDDIQRMLKILSVEQKQKVAAESIKPDGEKDLFNVIVKMFSLPEK